MEIGYMNQQNQIMIQEAKIVNQNYSINWLASVYHQDILVCVKSSWGTYEELKNLLQSHSDDMRYQDKEVYWQKVTKQTSVQLLTSTIKPPVDVILLPVTKNEILIPADEKECDKLQKTIKGIIKCTKRREAPLFSFGATEYLCFINDTLPVKREEVVALSVHTVLLNLHTMRFIFVLQKRHAKTLRTRQLRKRILRNRKDF